MDVRLFEVNLSRFPEPVECLLDIVVKIPDLVLGVHRVLTLHEKDVELAVVLQYCSALGLSLSLIHI